MTFEQAFAIVVSTEGGLSMNAADPGNWTGGAVGHGRLAGTKWGISAASYPTVDIAALDQAAAAAIYRRAYWEPIHGDELPGPLALIVFDSAVNSGVARAVQWLQAALSADSASGRQVPADGRLGPVTLAAVAAAQGRGAALFAEVLARRIVFDAGLPTWRTFGLGWARRLAALPFHALTVGA